MTTTRDARAPETEPFPPTSGTFAAGRTLEPGSVLSGRFVVERKLGEGGMGQVFAALDHTRGSRVAVKILGRRTPESITQIKREFRAAADLLHPNLVRLRELFCDGADCFFTMDLLEGQTLDDVLRESADAGETVLRGIFGELAQALVELHRCGMVHRDLKPSNFLVCGPERRVVLLDFGLAQPIGPHPEGDFIGTPAYMAPEQLLGDPLTGAADWYAFGVVLHEALTGKLPSRRAPLTVLQAAPADLRDLCADLLRLEPTERPSGEDVLRRLGAGPPSSLQISALPPVRLSLVDRKRELETLRVAFDEARAGRPSVMLVEGPSGIGKTALVERFLVLARREGALVLAGRCRERESMSYKAVDGLVDDIIDLLDTLPPADLPAVLPEHIGELAVLFPAFRAARAVREVAEAEVDTPDQGLVRSRAIGAFCDIVRKLRARAPVLIWIDDLQWSDAESALLVGPILGGAAAVPVVLIASYRDGPSQRGALLDSLLGDRSLTLPPVRTLSVGPLPPEDAASLALEFLTSESPEVRHLARSIGRDAGGHPLFIAELAMSLESGDDPATWEERRTLNQLVAARVAALPSTARDLLEIAAVAGAPRPRRILRQAAGLAAVEAEEALDVLRACRLARSAGLTDEDVVDLNHDRIREVVIHGLPEARRAGRHLSVARALEASSGAQPEALAAHYEGGGELARAGEYFVRAGDEAVKTLAFAHAAALYERGLRLARLEPEERHRVRVSRAESLAYAGKGPAAADAYLVAASACAPSEALELKRRAAEQLLISGHLDRGLALIEDVLRASGMRKTRTGRPGLLSLALGRLAVRLRGLRHVSRAEDEVSREELARIDAAWTIASSLGPVDFVRGAEFQTLHLLAALRAGEPRRLLRAVALEIPYAATPGAGSERRTAALLALANRLARGRTADLGAVGLLHLCRGLADYLQGRLGEAIEKFDLALEIHTRRCTGVAWETVTEQRFIIACLFFLGGLKRLSRFVPPLLADAEGKGNAYATICFRAGYGSVAFLVRGQVSEAHRHLERAAEEWNVTGFQVPHVNLLIGACHVDFYEGEGARSLSRIRALWPRIEDAGILRIAVLRVQLLQLRASALLAAARAARARGRWSLSRELCEEARHLVRRLAAERISRAAPLAALIGAGLDRDDGRREDAERRLRLAIAAFGAQHMNGFRAAARVRLGELVGGSEGDVQMAMGRAFLRDEGVADVACVVDMLAPGSMA